MAQCFSQPRFLKQIFLKANRNIFKFICTGACQQYTNNVYRMYDRLCILDIPHSLRHELTVSESGSGKLAATVITVNSPKLQELQVVGSSFLSISHACSIGEWPIQCRYPTLVETLLHND